MKKNLLSKKRIAALVLAAAFACIGCGCGSAPANEAPESTPGIALPTATPAPQPVSGGEIRMPMPVNADISDPLLVTSEEMLALFSLVYEGLLGIEHIAR